MPRRIRLTPAQWQAHIEAWQTSGLSQAAYCRRHGLSDKLFSLRKRQLKDRLVLPELGHGAGLASEASSELLPVKLIDDPSSQGSVYIQLPNGIELKVPLSALASLKLDMVEALCRSH